MEKCELVKIGMSREEVRAILGVTPGGNIDGRRTRRTPDGGTYSVAPNGWEGPCAESWLGFDCYLIVIYDGKGGPVKEIELYDNELLPEPSRMKQVRDFLEDWYENISCWLLKGSR
jgi:hypothetical protein